MNILIIGGAGFLGANLVRRCLRERGNQVTVVDSLDPRMKSERAVLNDVIDQITFHQGDMNDEFLMKKMVKGQDVIFNCAAQTSHPLSLSDPHYDAMINCLGNLTVLEAIRQVNPSAKVIYTSSSTVIGKATEGVVDETHGEAPLDIYSANKSVAEKYYRIYHRVHDIQTLSLRFANLYGPYGKGYPEFGFINYFISLAHQDKEITIYGDGQQNRNVMFVEDAADLLYECIQHHKIFGNVYFAVHREHYSVMDIAKQIVDVFGRGKLTTVDWPDVRKRIEIDDVIISAAKLYYEMKFEPRFTLREGLERTKEILEKK
ncbi:MAG: NAD-dependent epimerase/dehydratase family protein [Candidatus Omnitrophica bacterium]|nr:NAD-dependent epimerase/dehydratase family protein [Candidatus Omnitrophota bacterium]